MKFMTHIVVGYPNLKESENIARVLINAGSDFLEVQIPFSDPIADGPVIAAANHVALKNGTRPKDAFKLIRNLKEHHSTKILIMTYLNILKQYGMERFCEDAQNAGVYGLIVPDAPIDEERQTKYIAACRTHRLHPIQVISPITPEARLKKIAKVASGFVYCVARFGVTGAKTTFVSKQDVYLKRVRKYIKIPIAVGFGISERAHIQALKNKAEIAVIGSQIIREYQRGGISLVRNFFTELLQ